MTHVIQHQRRLPADTSHTKAGLPMGGALMCPCATIWLKRPTGQDCLR